MISGIRASWSTDVTETSGAAYRQLFAIHVLHHYWLDQGATTFDAIVDDRVRAQRLGRYDVRQFLELAPSRSTLSALAGLGGVYKKTALGLVAALPDDTPLDDDVSFEFFLTPKSAELATYTALSLRPRPVLELRDPATGGVLRYKEHTPVLSNLTGATRTWGAVKHLFLSSEYPTTAGSQVEELVTSGAQLRQLESDQPGATTRVLGAHAELPVYVHQGDTPIVNAPGVIGAPAQAAEISAETPRDVLAIIRLHPVRVDDDDFSLVGANGQPRPVAPAFEVHLMNRATTWQYLDKRSRAVISTQPASLPMTHFGNAGDKQKPSTEGITVQFDPNSPTRVARLVSDIFI